MRRYAKNVSIIETDTADNPLVDRGLVAELLDGAMTAGAEFAEVFAEDVERNSVYFDDGRIETLSSTRDRGVGIRVVSDGATGFAHTADLSAKGLRSAAQAATDAARSTAGQMRAPIAFDAGGDYVSAASKPPGAVGKSAKVDLVKLADSQARSVGAAISQVSARYGDNRRRILVANSDGVFGTDDQTRTSFGVSCVAEGDTGLQTGSETVGLTVGYEIFDRYDVAEMATRAAERALTKLQARPAPSGTLPVVIGPGSGGVLFHEACGHGLEADLVRKGASAFAGKVGELVASPLVTLIDDGTMNDEWGRYNIDDEGNPARCNVLIEDGVLVDYMWDGLRSRDAGRASSGNGRRESYRCLPMVRMTNTYLAGGDSAPADIIAGVDHGVYVARLGGGQVNTASGDFVFGMVEAYMIENGELGAPLREGQLIGNGPSVLHNIEAIGNDFAMGPPGTCGKDGQGVPVGDGVPTLRVAELTIGGTA